MEKRQPHEREDGDIENNSQQEGLPLNDQNPTPQAPSQIPQNEVPAMEEENQEDWQSEQSIDDQSEEQLDEQDDESDDSYFEQEQDLEEENFANKNIQINKFNKKSLLPLFQPYSKNYNIKKSISAIRIPPSKNIAKEVCAKLIKRSESIVQCYDCRVDQSCIICMECFKNGNHEGHRYIVKSAVGGCCDCGDAEAWNEKGFCKNHSGAFKDFDIKEDVVNEFKPIVNSLLYIYFHEVINQREESWRTILQIVNFFKNLNHDNCYYNKLTAICFQEKLPSNMSLNNTLDQYSILQNILDSSISHRFFNKWFDVFISMFSYYPFKFSILKHYIQNYTKIVDGKKSSNNYAISVSCQIITSYKLVEQYSLENNIGLGQRGQLPQKLEELYNFYSSLANDLISISNLTHPAPYQYWKMHIKSPTHIQGLFKYYKQIMKSVHKQWKKGNEAQVAAHYVKFSEIQFLVAQIFCKMLRIVGHDEELLKIIINVLWQQNKKTWKECHPEPLKIFRPIQRCLTLSIFTFFGFSLESFRQKKKALLQILNISSDTFQFGCHNILNKMFKTFFFYSKTQAYAGLGQTCYEYLYFFKIYSKILLMTDLLCVKLFTLLAETTYSLTFQSMLGIERMKFNNQIYVKEIASYFTHSVKIVKQTVVNYQPQIYITHSILEQSNLYSKEIEEIILNYFFEFKKQNIICVPQAQLKSQLLSSILPSECKLGQLWVKKNCTLNRTRKSYNLQLSIFETESQGLNIVGLNFDDFWVNNNQKNPFEGVIKSKEFIRTYNNEIFKKIWSQVTIKSLVETIQSLKSSGKLQFNEEISALIPTVCLIQSKLIENKSVDEGLSRCIQETKGCIPEKILATLSVQIFDNSAGFSEQERSKKAIQLKRRKLQMMKKKQQIFIKRQQISNGQEEITQGFSNLGIYPNSLIKSCCICKNEINPETVYILSISVRDHSRLLKLGSSVQCFSFSSCLHTFDYKCIQSLKKQNSKYYTCPLCKSKGDMVFPAADLENPKLEAEILDKFSEISQMMNKKVDFFEQILKSFYHYTLLCCLSMEKTLQKRKQIYKRVLNILRKKLGPTQLKNLRSKIQGQKLSLQFQSELIEAEPQALTFFLNLLGNNQALVIDEFQTISEDNRPIKTPELPRNRKLQHRQQKKFSELSLQVFRALICYFQTGQFFQEPHQKLSQVKYIALSCLSSLTQIQVNYQRSQKIIGQYFSEKCFLLFKKLPQHYLALASEKKCTQCSEISKQPITCLLCNWNGCQICKNGFAKTHINLEHGQIGAIMELQSGAGHYVTGERTVFAGFLYGDEWGNTLQKSTKWENFELNKKLYEEMQDRLIMDEIPSQDIKQ